MKRIKYYLLVIFLMFPLIVFGDSGRYVLCSYKCPHDSSDEQLNKDWCDIYGETVTIAFQTDGGGYDSKKLLGVVFDGRWDHEVKVDPSVLNHFDGSCPEGRQIQIHDTTPPYITVFNETRCSNSSDCFIYTSPSEYNERERLTDDVTVFDYFENGDVHAFRKKRFQYNDRTKSESISYEYSPGYLDDYKPPVSNNDALLCVYGSGSNQLALVFETNDDGSVSIGRVPLGFVSYADGKSYMCRTINSSNPLVSSTLETGCPYTIYCDSSKCYGNGGSGRTEYINDGTKHFVPTRDISGKICKEHIEEPDPLEVPEGRSICTFTDEFETFFNEKVIIPLRIAAVIIFLILTTVDYAKVIFDKEASPKKANTRLFKRIIALLIIFFANEIVNFVMLILGQGCPKT